MRRTESRYTSRVMDNPAFTRLVIDLDSRSATALALLIAEMNAVGGEPWTPTQLAASLLAAVLEDDLACHRDGTTH